MSRHTLIRRIPSAVTYDPSIYGYDETYWQTETGTPSVAAGKLRFNAASAISYVNYEYGWYEFRINSPEAPGAGVNKRWGLFSPDSSIGVYFHMNGAAFNAVSVDLGGTVQTTALTWDAGWTAAQTRFKIHWEADRVEFFANDMNTPVATHTVRTPRMALSSYLLNANANNMDVGVLIFTNIERASSPVERTVFQTDVEIGAVEIKDHDGATRLDIATEDSPAPANPNMAFVGGVYRAALPTYAAGDAATFHFDINGRLLTAVVLNDYADDSPFVVGTDMVLAMGLLADETATDSVDEGDIGLPRMTLNRRTIIASNVLDDAAFGIATEYVSVSGYLADETATDAVDEGDTGAARMTLNRRQITANQVLDDAAFGVATEYVGAVGFLADEAATDSVDEGDIGIPRMTLNRRIITASDFLEDSAHVTADYGTQVLAVRQDVLASSVDLDGDYSPLKVDSLGRLYVTTEATDNPAFNEIEDESSDSYFATSVAYGIDTEAIAGSQLRAMQVAVDNAALSATPNVLVTGGIFKADPLDTYGDNDAVPFHFDTNGRLLVAMTLTDYVDDSAFAVGTDSVLAIGFLADETATDSVDEGDIGLPRMTLNRRMIGANNVLDDAAFGVATEYVGVIGGLADEVATDSVDEGDVGALRMTLNRRLITADVYAEDSAHASTDYGSFVLAVRQDSLATLVGTDGDYAPLKVDALGRLYVTDVGTTTTSHHTAAVVAADGTDAIVDGFGAALIQVNAAAGLTSYTLVFQTSQDTTNFVTSEVIEIGTGRRVRQITQADVPAGTTRLYMIPLQGARRLRTDLTAIVAGAGSLTVTSTAVETGVDPAEGPSSGPVAGFDATGQDAYTEIIAANTTRKFTHLSISVEGTNPVNISLNGGTTTHFRIPANSAAVFDAVLIDNQSIQAQNANAGSNYANLAISVW